MAPGSQIRVPDWQRFWWGSGVPPGLLGEVALRVVVLYVVLAVAIRLMGRRTSSELTRNELLAIVALAAAIGPSIQAPNRGLLPPILIAVWVVLWQRAVASATLRSSRFERLMHGDGVIVVQDGVVQLRALKRMAVSRERLFAELRSQGLLHLGRVRRVYVEADGSFSVVKQDPPRPGLALVPAFDAELRAELPDDWASVACSNCGWLRERHAEEATCQACGSDAWVPPVAAG
jgi:uncharacterized membrane protein YcaP (DUF421 family)